MTDLTDFTRIDDHKDLRAGERIFVAPVNTDDLFSVEVIDISNTEYFHVRFGSESNVALTPSEWSIYRLKEFPLPRASDIEVLIYNEFQRCQHESAPLTAGVIAAQILSLMKGEIPAGVPVWSPPQDVTVQDAPPVIHALDDFQ